MKLFKNKSTILKSSVFLVPANYFDDFNDRTILKIAELHKPHFLLGSFQTLFYRIAAVLILALMLPTINSYESSQIDSTTIENYLALSNIDNMEIASLLNSEDLDRVNSNIKLDDSVIEDILLSNSNFETYITN